MVYRRFAGKVVITNMLGFSVWLALILQRRNKKSFDYFRRKNACCQVELWLFRVHLAKSELHIFQRPFYFLHETHNYPAKGKQYLYHMPTDEKTKYWVL